VFAPVARLRAARYLPDLVMREDRCSEGSAPVGGREAAIMK